MIPPPKDAESLLNPYAPTTEVAAETDDDSVRKRHLNTEVSIKSIGLLYGFFGIVLLPSGLFFLGNALFDPNEYGGRTSIITVVSGIYLLLGSLAISSGYGLFRMKPWGRIVGIVLSAIGLLIIPVGTLISVYFLYVLLSAKGRFVFTDQYQRIVAATPHMKRRKPFVVWVSLGFGILVLMVAFLFLGG